MQSKLFFSLAIICLPLFIFSQTEDEKDKEKLGEGIIIKDTTIVRDAINPLAPAKAAFYSAILPGLGQAYNKKYWKIPIVYAALGGSFLVYDFNNKEFRRYRTAFRRRAAGFTDDEFFGVDSNGDPLSTPTISEDGLIRAQRELRRNRDLSLLIAIGIYALNIIDANVDAHLLQFNVDENLAIKPKVNFNEYNATTNFGLALDFKF